MGTTFKPIGEITVLSFGGGVQSTAMLIASVLGKLPRPDVAIFRILSGSHQRSLSM